MTNIFEQASRLRVRFPSPQGSLSTEDLWSLPLTSTRGDKANLNDIAKALNKLNGAAAEQSFVTPASGPSTALMVAFDVVKYVIAVLIVERDAKAASMERKAKKDALMAAITKAENEELTTGSLAELKARLAAL